MLEAAFKYSKAFYKWRRQNQGYSLFIFRVDEVTLLNMNFLLDHIYYFAEVNLILSTLTQKKYLQTCLRFLGYVPESWELLVYNGGVWYWVIRPTGTQKKIIGKKQQQNLGSRHIFCWKAWSCCPWDQCYTFIFF